MTNQPPKLSVSMLVQLSKEELIQAILKLSQSAYELYQHNQNLEKRIKELEDQLKKFNKDSHTSSKPPSQDIHKQNQPKKNQSLRKKSGKRPGGQKGHQGMNRAQVDNPDKIVKCEPEECANCGKSLEDQQGTISEKRQERDIPPIEVSITEYQQIEKKCSCGCTNQGKFPDNIKSYVQIGSNAQAFLIYLNITQLIPFQRLSQLSKDIFGFPVSKGSIDNILDRANTQATLLYKMIMNIVKSSKYVGSDEGWEFTEKVLEKVANELGIE